MQLRAALKWAQLQLAQGESDTDAIMIDSKVLLSKVLNKPSYFLYSEPDYLLSDGQVKHYQQLIAERTQGQPIAYIIGEKEFWSLELKTDPSTLIPRPDTETLVEAALSLPLPCNQIRVLDLGTGTGAIALALASEQPSWSIVAVDKSVSAVGLAESNRQRLQLDNVKIAVSDWFCGVEGRFSLIVSNPPYIEESDHNLTKGDVRFEPRSALVSGRDGLDDIKQITEQACKHLITNGYLLFEHGFQQAEKVHEIMKQHGFRDVRTWLDLAGHQRVTGAVWAGN